jgi:hypothetical protein
MRPCSLQNGAGLTVMGHSGHAPGIRRRSLKRMPLRTINVGTEIVEQFSTGSKAKRRGRSRRKGLGSRRGRLSK